MIPRLGDRRFNDEAINQWRLDTVDALRAEGVIDHIPCPARGPVGRGITHALGLLFGAFPDLRLEVIEESADGELVAQVVRITGTNKGPFMGMPATGRQISVVGADLLRVRDGQVVEHWGGMSTRSMMAQLGLQPPGESGKPTTWT
jgi:predicted ester cyclase